jgi:hypothetical protein
VLLGFLLHFHLHQVVYTLHLLHNLQMSSIAMLKNLVPHHNELLDPGYLEVLVLMEHIQRLPYKA